MGEKKQKMTRQQAANADFDTRLATLLQELVTQPGRAAQAIGPFASSLSYVTSWLVSGLPADNQTKALMYDPIAKIVLLSFSLGRLVDDGL